MAGLTHAEVVVVADDPAYPVGTDEWNANHLFTGGAQHQLLFQGAASVISTSADLTFNDSTNVLTLGGTLAMGANGIQFTDSTLIRGSANILELRNGTAEQGFYIYQTRTDASNFLRGYLRWSSGVLEIGTDYSGTGTKRSIGLTVNGNYSNYALAVSGTSDNGSTVMQLRNLNASGYSALSVFDSSNNSVITFGYGNSGVGTWTNKAFWNLGAGVPLEISSSTVPIWSLSTKGQITSTPLAASGTPSTTGSYFNIATATFTDSNTAGSGTAASFAAHAFQAPTLAATNATVTTTNASTVYISAAPIAGTNETLTNAWALNVAAGNVNIAGNITLGGTLVATGAITIGNTVNSVTATMPNRTVTIVIAGTTYYLHAKTTND